METLVRNTQLEYSLKIIGILKCFEMTKVSDRKALNLNVPCISEGCIEIKIKLNFYFHTSFSHFL